MSHHRSATWHADDAMLCAYAGVTGEDGAAHLGTVLAASLEAHLLDCGRCRERLAALAADAGADDRVAAWTVLADRIDRPTHPLLRGPAVGRAAGRAARRTAGSAEGRRLLPAVVATPAMLGAALLAVALLAGAPLLAALIGGTKAWAAVLAVAPVAPMAAVALAYREEADPAGAIAAATPVAGLRVVALRACVVATVALPLAIAVQVWLDLTTGSASLGRGLAWCLPGLALAGVVLAAGTTRLDPAKVATALGLGWAAWTLARGTSDRVLRPDLLLDTLAHPATQLTALAVAALTLTFAVARRDVVACRRLA